MSGTENGENGLCLISSLGVKVLLRIERTVEAIESEKWSQTCILCPWEILSSCVRYVYSGFKLAETPISGTEEGKERSKRPPLAGHTLR